MGINKNNIQILNMPKIISMRKKIGMSRIISMPKNKINKKKLIINRKKPIINNISKVIIITSEQIKSIAENIKKILEEFNIKSEIINNITDNQCKLSTKNELYIYLYNNNSNVLPKRFIFYQLDRINYSIIIY
jgi:hypothetical protein